MVADLLAPPADWHRAFDLVVDYTVQAIPIPAPARRDPAGRRTGGRGGTLVIAAARGDDVSDTAIEGPPWPLTKATIQSFTTPDLHLIQLDQAPSLSDPTITRWRSGYLPD